jgi:hypothetical protein
MNLFLHASLLHTNWRMYTILRSTHRENCRRSCLSPATTLALAVHETDTTFSHTVRHADLWESSPVAEEMWRVSADGLPCAVSIKSSWLRTLVFHGQHVHTSWGWLFLSYYNAPFQVHVGKVVCGTDSPWMQRESFRRKSHARNAYPDTLHYYT